MGQNRLPARAGVPADQSFDVHGGPDINSSSASVQLHVAHPVVDASERFAPASSRRAAAAAIIAFSSGEMGPRLVGEVVDRGIIAVRRDQRPKRLHEMPRWTVDRALLLDGMSCADPAHFSPLDTNSTSIKPFGTEGHRDLAVESLRRLHEDANDSAGRRALGASHDLREVRRADSSFPSATSTRFTGVASAARSRGARRGTWPRDFLIDRAPPMTDLAQAGFLHERGVPRRRRPFRWIHLF